MKGVVVTIAIGAALAAGACSESDGAVVHVSAAASVGAAFDELAEAYAAETGTRVVLNTAASSTLATQIAEGAPADVFAAADAGPLERVVPDRTAWVWYAGNRMVVATRADQPLPDVETLEVDGTRTALCDVAVPCGYRAEEYLTDLSLRPASPVREADAAAATTRLRLGEVDAAVLYLSDVTASGGELIAVAGVPPGEVIGYPAAAVGDGGDGDAFLEFLTTPEAAAILQRHGLSP